MKHAGDPAKDRLLYLINAERDGELDDAEKEELQAFLERSGEARAMRADWQMLFNVLDSIPAEEPHPAIADRVLDGIGSRRRRTASLSGLFAPNRLVPVGLGFTAGLLLTVAVYEVSGPAPGFDARNAVGTTGIANLRGALDSVKLTDPAARGEIILRETEGGLELDVDIEGSTEFSVGIGQSGLVFEGLEFKERGLKSDGGSTQFSGGELNVSGHGKQAFTVFLSRGRANSGTGVAIEVSAGGQVVYSGNIGG